FDFALARLRRFFFQSFLELAAEDLQPHPFVDVFRGEARRLEEFIEFRFGFEVFVLQFLAFFRKFFVGHFDAFFGSQALQPDRFEYRVERRFLQFFVFGFARLGDLFFAPLLGRQFERMVEPRLGHVADVARGVLDQGDAARGHARVAYALGDRDDREEDHEGDAEDGQSQRPSSQRAGGAAPPFARRPSPTLVRTHEAGSISFSTNCERPASRRPSAIASTAARRASGSSGTRTEAVFSRHSYSAPSTRSPSAPAPSES